MPKTGGQKPRPPRRKVKIQHKNYIKQVDKSQDWQQGS
jgi:hypothetical protein